MTAPRVTVQVKIPAIKHGYGQRDDHTSFATEVEVISTSNGWVRVGDYEFSPQELLEACAIINRYQDFE
jgi:hypothetical protein